ncbi:hypothetical protein DERF_009060, partial [Dermatophagoides farinae]
MHIGDKRSITLGLDRELFGVRRIWFTKESGSPRYESLYKIRLGFITYIEVVKQMLKVGSIKCFMPQTAIPNLKFVYIDIELK